MFMCVYTQMMFLMIFLPISFYVLLYLQLILSYFHDFFLIKQCKDEHLILSDSRVSTLFADIESY